MLRGGLNLRMRDDHPDFPALVLANHLLGGTSTARVPARVREKEGLSYSTYTSFSASASTRRRHSASSSIFAPQNRAARRAAIREELERAVRDGFTPRSRGRQAVAARGAAPRAHAGPRPRQPLGAYLFVKRTFAWDIDFEDKIAALTPEQVNAALRRHIDPAKLRWSRPATSRNSALSGRGAHRRILLLEAVRPTCAAG